MDTTITILNALQAISIDRPTAFAVIVILVMITEGLMLVGLISLLLKIFSSFIFRIR